MAMFNSYVRLPEGTVSLQFFCVSYWYKTWPFGIALSSRPCFRWRLLLLWPNLADVWMDLPFGRLEINQNQILRPNKKSTQYLNQWVFVPEFMWNRPWQSWNHPEMVTIWETTNQVLGRSRYPSGNDVYGLYMVCTWLIYGLYMVQILFIYCWYEVYTWFIDGLYMDYLWI